MAHAAKQLPYLINMHLTSGGAYRDEFGIGFHISMLIECQSTGAVEIGFDDRQHDFDEIDLLEKFAALHLTVVPCLHFECRRTLEPVSQ